MAHVTPIFGRGKFKTQNYAAEHFTMSCPNKILTRRARTKAGLSPLPSLFKDAPDPPQAPPAPSPSPPSPGTPLLMHSSSFSSSDEESEANSSKIQQWVQCDHEPCQKWRIIPKDTEIDTKSAWYCSMHPDPAFQSCSAPEQKWKLRKKRAYTFGKLTSGQLVWAKMTTFAPWPAIVTPDPWSDSNYVCKEREGSIYHVEFLGKVRTHLWLVDDKVEPYHSNVSSLGQVSISYPQFDAAILEAESLKFLTDSDRLATCTYVPQALKASAKSKKTTEPKVKPPEKKIVKKTVRKKKINKHKNNTESMKSCEVAQTDSLPSLQKLFSKTTFNLQNFIQTNFKLGSDGVLKLVTIPNTGEVTQEMPSCNKRGRPRTKKTALHNGGPQGEMKVERKCNTPHRPNRVSPTIPDYFNKEVTTNSKGVDMLRSDMDQTVPTCMAEDGFSSAEAEAVREMEEIEGLLSMFKDNDTAGGNSLAVTDEDSRTGNSMTESSKAMSEDGQWIESVLGEIEQIEGLIQDLSQGQVVPY